MYICICTCIKKLGEFTKIRQWLSLLGQSIRDFYFLLYTFLYFTKFLNLGTCFSVIIRKVKVSFLSWGSTEVYEKGCTVPGGISTKNWETPLEWSTWDLHGAFWGPTSLDHKRAQGIKVKAKLNLPGRTGLGFVRQGDEPCPPLVPHGFTQIFHKVWTQLRILQDWMGCLGAALPCQSPRWMSKWQVVFMWKPVSSMYHSPANTTCKLLNLNLYNHISRKDNLGERWHSPTVVCNPNMATGSVPCDFLSWWNCSYVSSDLMFGDCR